MASADDASLDALTAQLAGTRIASSPSQPSTSAGPHASLESMLALAGLMRLRVAGDGNCAYHAACASADDEMLRNIGLWPVEHSVTGSASATPRDMKLQLLLRQRTTDWLQLADNAEHRRTGTFEGELEYDEASGRYLLPPPPPAEAVQVHRRTGTYAAFPQLRAIAEILNCTIISIDSQKLYDRVPVFTVGQRQTCKLKSWRQQLVPIIRQARDEEGGRAVLVILNNGLMGPGGHFDATVTSAVR